MNRNRFYSVMIGSGLVFAVILAAIIIKPSAIPEASAHAYAGMGDLHLADAQASIPVTGQASSNRTYSGMGDLRVQESSSRTYSGMGDLRVQESSSRSYSGLGDLRVADTQLSIPVTGGQASNLKVISSDEHLKLDSLVGTSDRVESISSPSIRTRDSWYLSSPSLRMGDFWYLERLK